MSSFLHGKQLANLGYSAYSPVGPSLGFRCCPHADDPTHALDDQAFTHVAYYVWGPAANDSYVTQLEREVDALRAQLRAKEQELAAARSGHRDEDRIFNFPIEVDESYPARIVEEIDLPFYFGGTEAEE